MILLYATLYRIYDGFDFVVEDFDEFGIHESVAIGDVEIDGFRKWSMGKQNFDSLEMVFFHI